MTIINNKVYFENNILDFKEYYSYNKKDKAITMSKQICYTEQALKFLSKINGKDAEKIIQKIQQYAAYPLELRNQVKKLQGFPAYRLRVGDYRVIFDEKGNVLKILKIGNRGDVYRGI